ncbi:hypothetical protein FEM48_Zijuj12G0056400 [Ziziphus jujuba var. spinosa]|uniref:Myb-like domain-containing protein n=1 Tax=Ziziphus jujuba var. spinosa TaxID=714518 RepID=A0A978UBH2_ZIZJJ|nr:hypothetical protein FEM48_Zijuj12G0056400 [Ziziphus jujuba var. spinosa]
MEMEDQYGMADLRQLMNGGRPHFPAIPQGGGGAADLFSGHRGLGAGQPPPQPYEMMMIGRQVPEILPRGLNPPPPPPHHHHHHHDFRSADSAATSTASITVTATSGPSFSGGLEAETAGCLGGDGGTGRWPRQETLTLLEIRSRLDFKFKEANQKGPLWDEVSRSGKKCREKFENLYKYYKKTKEGKAGRQDGKHYRFFRQLEALYGETSTAVSVPETHFVGTSGGLRFHTTTNNNNPAHQPNQEASYQLHKPCDSLSLSNSSEFDTTSSDDNDLMDNDSSEKRNRKRRGGGKNWKTKIKDFIDWQMRKLMEKQEAWLEKLMGTLEQKEKERSLREEEWRKEEAARIDREHKFWAKERAWIEARDSALMEALHKLTGKEIRVPSPEADQGGLMSDQLQDDQNHDDGSEMLSKTPKDDETWPELEISRLIQLRAGMESRFQQGGGFSDEAVLWEDIANKMARMGYERSALMCKDKWENINNYTRKTAAAKEFSKKRKENSRSSCGGGYFPNNESASSSLYNHGGGGGGSYCEMNEQGHANNDGSSPSHPNLSNAVHDSCFPFLMSEGENLWDNYGLKLSKGGQNQ